MQRWEYRIVSLRDGTYTSTLNELGREGWELVSVVRDDPPAPPAEKRSGLPIPGALGKLENAAEAIGRLGGDDASEQGHSPLIWALRRPLEG